MLSLLCSALSIFSLVILVWVILSWVRVPSTHPLARVTVTLDRIIYPLILPIRRVVPPLRLGGGALDLSPIVLILAIRLLQRFVC